jgi:hypothetical protein
MNRVDISTADWPNGAGIAMYTAELASMGFCVPVADAAMQLATSGDYLSKEA